MAKCFINANKKSRIFFVRPVFLVANRQCNVQAGCRQVLRRLRKIRQGGLGRGSRLGPRRGAPQRDEGEDQKAERCSRNTPVAEDQMTHAVLNLPQLGGSYIGADALGARLTVVVNVQVLVGVAAVDAAVDVGLNAGGEAVVVLARDKDRVAGRVVR